MIRHPFVRCFLHGAEAPGVRSAPCAQFRAWRVIASRGRYAPHIVDWRNVARAAALWALPSMFGPAHAAPGISCAHAEV